MHRRQGQKRPLQAEASLRRLYLLGKWFVWILGYRFHGYLRAGRHLLRHTLNLPFQPLHARIGRAHLMVLNHLAQQR
jgi:hypothetical protein